MEATEIIRCRGHPLVSASHPTTFEVTMEEELSENGHCIIGVGADKGAAGLSTEFRDILCRDGAKLTTTLACEGFIIEVQSEGSAAMVLDHRTDCVWRKSSFVCGRTIGIHSDHVAATLPITIITHLKAGRPMVVTMTVRGPG
ncbi:MAG: DUF371 domain-containing protein [Methanoregula sp.]|nr:MAG: DUF371 domain-containing protein [Methanoregula sp.]